MSRNPLELFHKECPELAKQYEELVDAQKSLPGLDPKTKQLVNIAIQTANRNPRGVKFHALMARNLGATREEVVGAVVMNLHLTGLASVLDCLPSAIEAYEGTGEKM
ncbi:MAG: carboxymuconolactone decarboxylase family protein [Candidatus Atribacteria bacterium]|nr:carboxymuconolactone decarboxylase family protein [Candidatus Atribacteria bacterium]